MSQFNLSREDFELVTAIGQNGTVTRAAEHLHLSQSAVSHHLRGLEERIGEPLFQRFPRKMIPTPMGEDFIAQAKQIALSFREMEQRIVARAKHGPRTLRLATECYTSYSWLPQLVREQTRAGSRMQIQIVMEATSRVREALREGEIDVAILNTSGDEDSLSSWPLFRDEMVLVVPASHAFASERWLKPEMLSGETMLLHTAPGVRNPIAEELFPPRISQYVPFTDAILQMVSGGMGVAPFARWLIAPYLKTYNLRALQLGRSGIHREWKLAARDRHPRSEEFARLAKALRASLGRQLQKHL